MVSQQQPQPINVTFEIPLRPNADEYVVIDELLLTPYANTLFPAFPADVSIFCQHCHLPQRHHLALADVREGHLYYAVSCSFCEHLTRFQLTYEDYHAIVSHAFSNVAMIYHKGGEGT